MQKQLTEFYLSQLLYCPIYYSLGKTVGNVKDSVVLWNGGIPKVTGIQRTSNKHKIIPAKWPLLFPLAL